MATPDLRLALLRAAEQLFVERGIDHVLLKDVSVAAGDPDGSAAQRYFGTTREVIEALLERHSAPIQEAWLERLRGMDEQRAELVELVELLVRPLVAKLDDPDGGRAYLEICAQLAGHSELPLTTMRAAWTPGAAELGRRLHRAASAPLELFPLHALRLSGVLYRSIVDYARLSDKGVVAISRDVFCADLIRSLVGLLASSGRA